jgi:hypothetical protein
MKKTGGCYHAPHRASEKSRGTNHQKKCGDGTTKHQTGRKKGTNEKRGGT